MTSNDFTADKLIDLLGGTHVVAKLLRIKPPSVSAWRKSGIPDDKLIRVAPAIERITNGTISRRDLFPDDWAEIWPELVEA